MDIGFRPLVIGNWKMNGVATDLEEIERIAWDVGELSADVAICPPATLLQAAAKTTAGSRLLIGAQDCSAEEMGAYTGDISARMIADCRARFVILGHSERRQYHGETDLIVKRKAQVAFGAALTPVICVGESEAERLADETTAVLEKQMRDVLPLKDEADRLVIAYEPLWAIGAGRIPNANEILSAHQTIRRSLTSAYGFAGRNVPILYGGSVKPENAAEIVKLADVDGVLVGGASLRADTFLKVCCVYKA